MKADGRVFDLPVVAASRWIFTCYGIIGDEGSVVMVDAGLPSSARGALGALRSIGRQPKDVTTVLATHGYSDHVGGMSTVLKQTPASALLPQRCRNYLSGATPRSFGLDANVRFLPMLGQHRFSAAAAREFVQTGTSGGYGRQEQFTLPFTPSGFLADGDSVPGAPGWMVIATPGHTDDSISLYHAGSATLLSGDGW
ncbi:MAG: MBL fold metallo-hydrolase [Candidatus Microthrix subdominans]|jgi:glyoxylase-like metal-dependent hydrolase (beta-lactamase superfamily II)